MMTATSSNNEKAVEASYRVSLLIAKAWKLRTIGENLILPAVKQVVKTMFGEKSSKELNTISLSDNTVCRRINEMADNVKEQLVSKVLDCCYYDLHLNKSADIVNQANIIIIILSDMKTTKLVTKIYYYANLCVHEQLQMLFLIF